MPDLSRMNLDQLQQLSIFLADLARAGSAVETYVEFDLTPGRPVVMHFPDMVMPGVNLPAAPRLRPLDETLADLIHKHRSQPARDPALPLVQVPDTPQAPAAPKATAPQIDVKAFVDGVMADLDAPKPAATEKPAPWTEEEDQRAVDLMARLLAEGAGMGHAYRVTAETLGRPLGGFQWRCKTKLKRRIEAAMASAAPPVAEGAEGEALGGCRAPRPATNDSEPEHPTPQPEPAAVATPGGDDGVVGAADAPTPSLADPGRESAGGEGSSPQATRATAEPVQIPPELRDVVAHLRSVQPFGPWTPARDREMLDYAEDMRWPLGDICLEMKVSTAQAQQRLSTLTKGQLYKRAQVHAAMVAMGYGAAEGERGAA